MNISFVGTNKRLEGNERWEDIKQVGVENSHTKHGGEFKVGENWKRASRLSFTNWLITFTEYVMRLSVKDKA